MSPSIAYTVHRSGRVFQFPPLDRASWRFNAHPDGSGTDWEEDVDVDRPHGLDYRAWNHLAKAFRKRIDKEHESVGDGTAGGEHVPGIAQVLRQVDGTADVSGAYDATLFQANGLVHSSGNQTVWCITDDGADPTICLIDPDKQCKGADITWTGAQQFDASVDMTIMHVDGSATFTGPVRFEGSAAVASFDGTVDFSVAAFDGTVDFGKRADFTSIGVAGDSTFAGAVDFEGAVKIDGSVEHQGLVSFCANNVYDSTWFDCSVAGTYTKTHDLSSTALLTLLYFKDTGNGLAMGANRIYAQYAPWLESNQESGASINNLTTTQVTIQAGADNAAFSLDASGQKVYCNTGQYRVVALRMV
jgi:hypothetical protein